MRACTHKPLDEINIELFTHQRSFTRAKCNRTLDEDDASSEPRVQAIREPTPDRTIAVARLLKLRVSEVQFSPYTLEPLRRPAAPWEVKLW